MAGVQKLMHCMHAGSYSIKGGVTGCNLGKPHLYSEHTEQTPYTYAHTYIPTRSHTMADKYKNLKVKELQGMVTVAAGQQWCCFIYWPL